MRGNIIDGGVAVGIGGRARILGRFREAKLILGNTGGR
jgi:hypothetical protein